MILIVYPRVHVVQVLLTPRVPLAQALLTAGAEKAVDSDLLWCEGRDEDDGVRKGDRYRMRERGSDGIHERGRGRAL